MARSLVILTDGLRPDAITRSTAPCLTALRARGAHTSHARTVKPSVTVAALTSFATGVAPETHGLVQPGLGFLTRLSGLMPLGRALARHRVPTIVVAGPIAARSRPVAWALAACAGVARVTSGGAGALRIAEAALAEWHALAHGLLFVYLPDCDQAGHSAGWMSPAYLGAVAAVDAAAGRLAASAEDALTVVVSDHGGGGVEPKDHDAPHPLNEHIPLTLAGPGIARGRTLLGDVSLLDVPPTLLRWFGASVPESYEGRVLEHAFEPQTRVAVA